MLQAQIWQGSKLVGVTPKHELPRRARGPRAGASGSRLEAFPPGDYELRVVATGPAGGQAERRVGFRVVN